MWVTTVRLYGALSDNLQKKFYSRYAFNVSVLPKYVYLILCVSLRYKLNIKNWAVNHPSTCSAYGNSQWITVKNFTGSLTQNIVGRIYFGGAIQALILFTWSSD
jgi:hypothetical protein